MKLEAVEVESHDGAQPPNKSSSQPVLYQSLLQRRLQALFLCSLSQMFRLDSAFQSTQQHKQVQEIEQTKAKSNLLLNNAGFIHQYIYLRKRYHTATGVWAYSAAGTLTGEFKIGRSYAQKHTKVKGSLQCNEKNGQHFSLRDNSAC